MKFSEPIYFKENFRYIPCFPRYAINIDSEVIDTFTNRLVTKTEVHHGYNVIYVYNPDKNGYRYTRTHRLLALAWIPNNDFINKPIINHIDGVRSNNKLENLEWCSLSENTNHALDTGLNKTPVKMKTRDVFTGEVVIYKSVSEMSHKLGMSNVSGDGYAKRLPGYLYNKRYEIKFFDDNSPWYFEDTEYDVNGHGKSIYTITTFNKKTGELRKFSNLENFYKTYNLWTKSKSVDNGLALFRDMYKDFDVSYVRNAVSGPYRVLDLETKQIEVFDSIIDVGKYINRSRTEIQYDLSRRLKFIYSKKWLIATGINEIVLEDYRDKPKPFVKIVIVNSNDNTERIADSIKHAARITSIQSKTITKHLNTDRKIKGLSFRALE